MVLLVAGLSGINLDPSNLGISPAAKINPIHYLIVFIAIAWLLKSVIRKKFEIAKSSLNTPLLIFLFYVLVSLAWVPYLSADTILQLIRLLFAVLMYFFTISIINHKKTLRQAMFFWWLGAVLSSLFVMLQFLGIISYGIYVFQQGVTRYAGLSKYTNNLSMYLNFSIVLGLAYFTLVKSSKFKLLIMLGIILMFFGVLLSFTRAAWVGLAVGMLIFTLFVLNKEQKLRHRLYILFLFLTPALLFSSLMTDYGKKSYDLLKRLGSLQNIFEDPSLQSRLPIWEGGYEMCKDTFGLGAGVGSFRELYTDYIELPSKRLYQGMHRSKYPHSFYNYLLAEFGIIGFFIFFLMLFRLFKDMIILTKKFRGTFYEKHAIMIMIGIVIFLIHGIVEQKIDEPVLWLFIGLGMAAFNIAQKEDDVSIEKINFHNQINRGEKKNENVSAS